MCHIKRHKCAISSFGWIADDSDCNHENDFIDPNDQDNKVDNDLFTSLPIITEDSDDCMEMNENVTKVNHNDNTSTTLPLHDTIEHNKASKTRPLDKAECQKHAIVLHMTVAIAMIILNTCLVEWQLLRRSCK